MKLKCYWLGVFLVFAFSLRMEAQPKIVDQPTEKLNVPLHEKIGFHVGAEGNEPLFYQWRRNNVPIPGATNSNYEIDDVLPRHGGIYSVVVADEKGDTVSDEVLLTLNIPQSSNNDDLNAAFRLENSNQGVIGGENKDATFEPEETDESGVPRHQGKRGGKSIWFKWTAPSNGIVTFRTAGSTFDTLLGIYTVSEKDPLAPLPGLIGDDDRGGFLTSIAIFNAVAQQEYRIAVDGFVGANGFVVLSWDFENTTDIFPMILSQPTSQTLGLNDRLDLSIQSQEGSQFDWFLNDVSAKGAGAIFSIATIKEEDVGRYSARIRKQGREIIREVFSDPADIQINISEGGTDTNVAALDKFYSATEVETAKRAAAQSIGKSSGVTSSLGSSRAFTTTQIFSTAGATKDPGEPNHCGVAGGASEWFLYQAPANGTLHISTDGSSYNTVLAVYTATSFDFSSLVSAGCANSAAGTGGEHVYISAIKDKYYYIAVDGVGGASGTVKLNINLGNAPSISAHPQSKSVVQGSNATFTVTASGTATLSYRWKFNGTNISGATGSSYTRTNVQPAHVGNYSVTVSNAINVVNSSNATLTLLIPPGILTQPTNQTVSVGGNATFSVSASGSAPLSYQWRWNGTNISNATNSSYALFDVSLSAAGTYSVQVTNAAGSTNSSDASLTINAAPSISQQPTSKTVATGSNPSLTVTASGFPAPAYQWQFNNANILTGTSSLLTITNFQAANEGNYRVIITNSQGSVTSSIAVLRINSPRFGSYSTGTNGLFQLDFIGVANSNYVFQFSTNLPAWWPIATNSSPDGFITFQDTDAATSSLRFYRTVQQ